MSIPRRNELCPCGSGEKYKKCHGSFSANSEQARPAEVWQEIEERSKALEAQREKQQGLGRPIISTVMGESRFVAVGKNVHYAKNCKTFHDFLRHFFLKS